MQIESPEAAHLAGGGNININRVSLTDRAREKVLPFLLALSVLTNLAAIYSLRDAATEQRLTQYTNDWFKTHEFSDLKSEVAVQGRLLSFACKKES